jgi:hypothetical protein
LFKTLLGLESSVAIQENRHFDQVCRDLATWMHNELERSMRSAVVVGYAVRSNDKTKKEDDQYSSLDAQVEQLIDKEKGGRSSDS